MDTIADKETYLIKVLQEMGKTWPGNRMVNIVCHGHSVPAGYFTTPVVNSLEAYPHLLFVALKKRFVYSLINVIVTAIGGEGSEQGAQRFESDVLCHKPDVVTIDYSLNDRDMGLQRAEAAWRKMIEASLARGGEGDSAHAHARRDDDSLWATRSGPSNAPSMPNRCAGWRPSITSVWPIAMQPSSATSPMAVSCSIYSRTSTTPTALGMSWSRASCCAGSRRSNHEI